MLLLQKITAMKNRATFLTIVVLTIFSGMELYAQCVPDNENCIDTEGPGQFCPLDLPKAGLSVLYDEVVTIISPGSYQTPLGEVTIHFIEIDSVKNLPPGINYFPNKDKFFPDTAYCIQLTGTPTQIGVFKLAIHIGATVDILGNQAKIPVVDDSSVVITVLEVLGINPNQGTKFQVFQNVPNPFSEVTRLDYYIPFDDRIELNIYNVMGVLVYHEEQAVPPGEHSFRFDGKELQPGTYLFRVGTSETSTSGKFVKSR